MVGDDRGKGKLISPSQSVFPNQRPRSNTKG